jgi:predicted phage tail component-like protein
MQYTYKGVEMIPYLIINGVSSKTVNGLIIQSLPPITKPKMRYTSEEVEGRDGDVVTKLGYSAYDKSISIGLKGDFDIDEVMQFFNTEGKITFSNEPDKYYNFAQYDLIDFNRLLRFRTANVNIHVQPFKYSIEEPAITWDRSGDGTITEIPVRNTGSVYSKPRITIEGEDDIYLYINNKEVLKISIPTGAHNTIIIDALEMNATDVQGNYLNRLVSGDYNKVQFESGFNILRVTGGMDSVKIENYSRWI